MAHAIGHKPVYKPTPDIGCCTKVGSFLVGTAGVAGLMAAAFSGPLAKPVADAASAAVASTAGKVVEATGLVNGIKTAGNLLANGATAVAAQTVSVKFDDHYRANCASVMQDWGCLKDASGSLLAGVVAIATLGFMLYAVNCSKRK